MSESWRPRTVRRSFFVGIQRRLVAEVEDWARRQHCPRDGRFLRKVFDDWATPRRWHYECSCGFTWSDWNSRG